MYPLEDFQNDIIQLLKASPLYQISISRINPMYHHFFGRQLVLSEFGFKDLNAIINANPHLFKVKMPLFFYSSKIAEASTFPSYTLLLSTFLISKYQFCV